VAFLSFGFSGSGSGMGISTPGLAMARPLDAIALARPVGLRVGLAFLQREPFFLGGAGDGEVCRKEGVEAAWCVYGEGLDERLEGGLPESASAMRAFGDSTRGLWSLEES
jgi:hypothetical protein